MSIVLRRLVVCAFGALAAAFPVAASAQDWSNLATVSMTNPTTPKLTNRYVCYTDGRDIRCDSPSLYVTTGGLVGIGTTNPQTQLEVNGTVSATAFVGDGAGLTNVVAGATDRIVSGTNAATHIVAISETGYISITQAGANAGWFSPYTGLVTLGISATGGISGTSGYFTSNVAIGTTSSLDLLTLYHAGAGGTAPALVLANGRGELNPAVNDIYGAIKFHGLDSHGSGYRAKISAIAESSTGQAGVVISTAGSGGGGYDTDATVERMRITSAGNVGIGTITPTATLQVSGSFIVSSTQTDSEPSLYVANDGKVAIGTMYPSSTVHFVDPTGLRNVTIQNLNDTQFRGASLYLKGPNSLGNQAATMLYHGNSNNGATQAYFAISSYNATYGYQKNIFNYVYNEDRMDLLTANLRRITINSSGNVGISRTTPLAKLDVNGTISASDAIQVGESTLACGSVISGSIRYNTTSDTLQVCTGSGWKSLVSGTATAVATGLEDRIVSGTTSVVASQDRSLTFSTANAQRMIIGKNGNVGIGTSNPGAPLDVLSTDNATAIIRANTTASLPAVLRLIGTGSGGSASQDTKIVAYQPPGGAATDAALDFRVRKNGDAFDNPGTIMTLLGIGRTHVSGTFVVSTTEQDSTSPTLWVANDGSVGIGTTYAGAKLRVYAEPDYSVIARFDGNSGTAPVRTLVNNQGGHDAQASFMNAGVTQWTFGNRGSTNNFTIRTGAGAFGTAYDHFTIVSTSGYVGIGTTTPSSTLHVQSTYPVLMLGDSNASSLAEVGGRIAFTDANGFTHSQIGPQGSDNEFVIRNNNAGPVSVIIGGGYKPIHISPTGRIGINNNTDPRANLDVIGTISATGAIQVGQSTLACGSVISGSIRYNTTSDTLQVCTGDGWKSLVSGTTGIATAASSTGAIQFNSANALGGDTDNLFWDNANKRLGVGTSSPAQLLDVANTANTGSAADNASMQVRSTNRNASVVVRASSAHAASVQFGDAATTKGLIEYYNAGSGSPDAMRFTTSGTEKVRITHDGNVGIGTTTPAAPLQVSASIEHLRLSKMGGTSHNPYVSWYHNAVRQAFIGWGSAGTNFNIAMENGNRLDVIASTTAFSGNVGIGTTAPGTMLDVSTSGTGIQDLAVFSGGNPAVANNGARVYFTAGSGTGRAAYVEGGNSTGASNGHYLAFGTSAAISAPSERMRISHDGKVGIGTTAPAATLQVSGTFTVSTSAQNTTPSLYVGSNGRIGKGTTSPQVDLEVADGGRVRATGSSGSYVQMNGGNADGSNLQLNRGGSASQNAFFSQYQGNVLIKNLDSGATIFTNTTSDTERMRIQANGNIGISTSAPLAKLDVNGTISATDAIQVGDSSLACSAGIPGAIRYNAGNMQYCNGSSWTSLSTVGGGQEDRITSGTHVVVVNTATGYTSLSTGGTTWGYLGSAASYLPTFLANRVGISTTSPNATLDVAGHVRLSGPTSNTIAWGTTGVAAPGAGSAGMKLHLYGATPGVMNSSDFAIGVEAGHLWFNTTTGMKWYVGSSERMRLTTGGVSVTGFISTTGVVDVGTQVLGNGGDSAGAPTYSWTGDTNTGIFTPGADTIGLSTDGTERMRVTGAGNVGIGVSPLTRLHVSGGSTLLEGGTVFVSRTNTQDVRYLAGQGPAWRTISTINGATPGKFVIQYSNDNYVANFVNAMEFHPIGTVSLTNALHLGASSLTCNAGLAGAVRYNATSGTVQVCQSSAWTSLVSDSTLGSTSAASSTGAVQFNANGNLGGDTNTFFWDNANKRLGIGITAPAYSLDISTTGAQAAQLALRNTSTGDAGIFFDASNGDIVGVDYMWFGQKNNLSAVWETYGSAGDISLMPKSGAGYVGIGTSAPTKELEISRSTAGDVTARINVTTTGHAYSPILSLNRAGATEWTLRQGSGTYDFGIEQDDSRKLTIQTTTGNVGIGTTAPAYSLDVKGTARISSTAGVLILADGNDTSASVAMQTYIDFMDRNDHSWGWIGDGFSGENTLGIYNNNLASGGISFGTSLSERVRITSAGNVGIGTAAPNEPLHVSSTTGRAFFGDGGGATRKGLLVVGAETGNYARLDAYDYGAAAGRQLRINTFGGNVSIGAIAPKASLDVAGTISASDAVQVGSSSLTCGAGIPGAIRYSAPNLQYCNGTSWTTLGGGGGGADNLGNHTATQSLAMNAYNINGVNQVLGGFGAVKTGGTLDWNDVSNARSGSGYSLLLGTAANGPGTGTYFHPFSFEYGTKDGSGQLTQFAIPYGEVNHLNGGFFMRGRYSGTWSSWRRILTENSAGNVGIGTSAPASDLEIEKTAAGGTVNAEVQNLSTANNSAAQLLLRTGTGSVYTSIQTNNGSGIPYSYIGGSAGVTGGMYLDVLANAPMVFRTNGGTERMRILGDGKVGIGTASPIASFHINSTTGTMALSDSDGAGNAAMAVLSFFDSGNNRIGFVGDGSSANNTIFLGSDAGSVAVLAGANNCTYTSGASWSCSSDRRMKDRITPLADSLEKIVKLQGVSYHWRATDKAQDRHIGLIAQDVQKVFPEVVATNDNDGMLQLDYSALISPIIEAIKQLKGLFDGHDARLEALEAQNKQLRAELDAIKAAILTK